MSDLAEEIECPGCGQTLKASSFLTSKVSGEKICVKCFRAEKKATADGGGEAAPATVAAPAAATSATDVEIPAEGNFPCPNCGNEVDVKFIVTSKRGSGKICNVCYFKEFKAGKAEEGEDGAAPAPTAAAGGGTAAAVAEAPAAAAVAVEQTELGSLARVRAQTVSLQPVVSPTGEIHRRGFVGWLALGWTAFVAASAQMTVALVRFMFPNVLFEPPSSFNIGFPEEFEIGKVDTKFKAQHGIWVVRNEEGIYILSTVCTHLGCTPNWLENEAKFKCPCHGSGFRKSGIHFEGPAPRPLERFRIVLSDDGQILVDTSKKYQFEKGQWDDSEAFLLV